MSKSSNVKTVKTPGEIGQPDGDAGEGTSEDSTALPTDSAGIAALVAAEVKKALTTRAAPRANVPAAALPDQSDIDANTIKEAVLTKQGYVVPATLGARPAHLQNLV